MLVSSIRSGSSVLGVRTDANDESTQRDAREDVFDKIGLAGADQGGGLSVVLVVVGGAGDDAHSDRGREHFWVVGHKAVDGCQLMVKALRTDTTAGY